MLILKYIYGNPYIYARVSCDGKYYWIYCKAGLKITTLELLGLCRKIQKNVPLSKKYTRRTYDTAKISSLYTALFFSAVNKQLLL